jgi:hypothetical protein
MVYGDLWLSLLRFLELDDNHISPIRMEFLLMFELVFLRSPHFTFVNI